MANIPVPRFTLKDPNTKDRSLIYLIYRYRGLKFRYSTQCVIHISDWNKKTQRAIQKERRPDLWAIRQTLDTIATYATEIYISAHYGDLSKDQFKYQMDLRTGRINAPAKPQAMSLFAFIDAELAEMKETGMKRGSLKVFELHAGILKAFAKSQGTFDYADVDWSLRLSLIDWLSSRGVQLAYGNKTLNVLRQFMERARRKGLHASQAYQGKGWPVRPLKAETVKVTLSMEELTVLYQMNLNGYLKKVRDMLLIGVGTGQRFSDFRRLAPPMFYTTAKGVQLLSIVSQKTGTPAKIPLSFFPWMVPLLEEYQYTAPALSMQKFNEGLKALCKAAQINEQVLVVEQYIGRKARLKRLYRPKYEVISSHTCRRSFATNLYRMGYSLAQIMPMTGHSTETQLRVYIGIDAEENAERIALGIT